jgi:peptide-methionine (S)-S-oxide reductase
LGVVDGVYRTRAGYTGGESKFPTYHNLGNHTEALQIDFDPNVISFEEVVELFWNNHNPLRQGFGRQYMAAVWYHDESQREIIDRTRESVATRLGQTVQTPVLPLDVFYLAEGYHQKYRLQQSPSLLKHFARMYSDAAAFVNSTVAARLNGFLYGYGSKELFEREREGYGIPVDELRQAIHFRESQDRSEECGSGQCSI